MPTSTARTDAEVLVQRGAGAEAKRLRNEAEMAQRLAGPFVLPLLTADDDRDADVITLVYEGSAGGCLTDWAPSSPVHLARLFAAAFEALADLHRAGVAHGALSGDSIVLDAHDRPLLARLADAQPATPRSIDADIAALVDLLASHCARLDTGAGRVAQHLSRSGRTQRRLQRLVAGYHRLASPHRPSAQLLGSRLAAMASTERPPLVSNPSTADAGVPPSHGGALAPTRRFRTRPPRPEPDSSRGRWPTVAAAVVALVLGVGAAMVAVLVVDASGADQSGSSTVAPATQPVARADGEPSPARHDTRDEPRWQVRAEPLLPPPNCDGVVIAGRCEVVELGTGFVTVGSRRFAIGSGNEHLAFGDWDCDGVSTVAAVRPESGEVFVFDGWSFEEPVTARIVALLDDVAAPRTVALGNGCHDLEVPNGNDVWTLTGAQT